MKNSIRNLIITFALVTGIFGIVNGQITGEFSTDIGIGDESDNSFQSWKDRALTAEKTIKDYERDNENLNFLVKNLERMILEK